MQDDEPPVRIPITDELDLHTFSPREAGDLIGHYLGLCQERGWREVRIIHGKGDGTLRELVHARLRRSPLVASFRLAGETGGGWGATRVTLKPRQP